MSYRGDIALGSTLDFKFTTRKFSTGAPNTLAGSPVISAYPDNSTTQLTAGITLTVDFDGVTGLNHVRVVASSGNGYATASNYDLVITTGTVDSVSVVGEVIGSFSIEARSGLRPATAGRTVVVDAAGLVDANVVKLGPSGAGTAQTARDVGASVLLSSGTGTGQVKLSAGYVAPNWGDVGNPTTTVGLSGTTIKAVTDNVSVGTIAANALNASALATDAVTEIQSGLATAAAQTTLQTSVDDIPTNAEFNARTLPTANYATAAAQTTAQTSIDDLPTNAEMATVLGTSDDAVLAQLALVKAKTDQLTFTKTNEIDANMQSINGTTVNGDGAGTPWGP